MNKIEISLVSCIRDIAESNGYCIGIHGSLERDIDLIAAPWEITAVSHATLIELIRGSIGATIVCRITKPLGRMGYVLQVPISTKNIDISVCPRVSPPIIKETNL